MKRSTSPSARLRVDFKSGLSVGPGKIALLEQIANTGSLSQAARDLRLSYRRAWLLLDDLNRGFAEPVVKSSVGGRLGGGAQLTTTGRNLIADYRRLERAASTACRRQFKFLQPLAGGSKVSRKRLSKPL